MPPRAHGGGVEGLVAAAFGAGAGGVGGGGVGVAYGGGGRGGRESGERDVVVVGVACLGGGWGEKVVKELW